MNISNKKILVTGGGSGIGLAIAKSLSEAGNHVLIVGRNEEKLKTAAAGLKNVDYFAADVTNDENLGSLVAFVNKLYGGLDMLINNAAATNIYKLGAGAHSYEKAKVEIDATYLSVVNLTEKLLPVLEQQPEPAIVNINAVIGLTPSIHMPTHSASKAALRAYTQVLRLTLITTGSPVKVFEVYPPLVNTEFSLPLHGGKGLPPEEVAQALLNGLENDTLEIRIGATDQLYQKFFTGTEGALEFLNQPRG